MAFASLARKERLGGGQGHGGVSQWAIWYTLSLFQIGLFTAGCTQPAKVLLGWHEWFGLIETSQG